MNETSGRVQRWESARVRLAVYVAAGFLGAAASLVAVIVTVRSLGPGTLPPVTEDTLQAARATWERAGPADYDVEVQVLGRAAAVYRVQVRYGNVISASRNGQPLPQQRTWNTWTVPGMFETIARDLEVAARVQEGKAATGAFPLELRGRFDPDWGFPTRYQRTELRRFDANQLVEWEATLVEKDSE